MSCCSPSRSATAAGRTPAWAASRPRTRSARTGCTEAAPRGTRQMRTLIRNVGTLVTGDVDAPIADADSILIEDGRIAAVGRGLDGGAGAGGHLDQTIDAKGTTAIPGLIDSHAHPVFGDFTPRQQTQSFIESGLHGGVTTVISAGEVHLPGRPKDIVGLKALAIVAAKAWAALRPAGVTGPGRRPVLPRRSGGPALAGVA